MMNSPAAPRAHSVSQVTDCREWHITHKILLNNIKTASSNQISSLWAAGGCTRQRRLRKLTEPHLPLLRESQTPRLMQGVCWTTAVLTSCSNNTAVHETDQMQIINLIKQNDAERNKTRNLFAVLSFHTHRLVWVDSGRKMSSFRMKPEVFYVKSLKNSFVLCDVMQMKKQVNTECKC